MQWLGWGGASLVTGALSQELVKERILSSQKQSILRATDSIILKPFEFEVKTVKAEGQVSQQQRSQGQLFEEDLGQGVTLEMVAIWGGSFWRGTEEWEIERLIQALAWDGFRREKPRQQVTLPPFFLSKYPITQAQWKTIASLPKVKVDLESNPSHFLGENLPVERVSWSEAVEFSQRLCQQTGKEYRLPTEAEWEYACRGGTTTPFSCGETLKGELANYDAREIYAREPGGEYRQQTTPVGSLTPNPWGLYDLHGNVWEWCEDNRHENYQGAPKDGSVWLSGDSRLKVIRGGSWSSIPWFCRSAFRNELYADLKNDRLGFRVVCNPTRTVKGLIGLRSLRKI